MHRLRFFCPGRRTLRGTPYGEPAHVSLVHQDAFLCRQMQAPHRLLAAAQPQRSARPVRAP